MILFGCGGIRYSQVAPNAKDFHPKKIGVLPVESEPSKRQEALLIRLLPVFWLIKAGFPTL